MLWRPSNMTVTGVLEEEEGEEGEKGGEEGEEARRAARVKAATASSRGVGGGGEEGRARMRSRRARRREWYGRCCPARAKRMAAGKSPWVLLASTYITPSPTSCAAALTRLLFPVPSSPHTI